MKMRCEFFFILCLIFNFSIAQEYITDLESNPVLMESDINKSDAPQKAAHADDLTKFTIENLQDDFSSPAPYHWADPKKWSHYKDVFINSSYVDTFLSVGVATFDAINSEGFIYPHLSTDTSRAADQLVSHAILLEGKANVYLSFYYMTGGLGDMPQENDTLVLEFLSASNNWVHAETFVPDGTRNYRSFITQIPDSLLYDGFKFRLTNYVSLIYDPDYPEKRSNSDLWHIDYVILDAQRSVNDVEIRDLRFVKPIGSFLDEYESMPKYHFDNFGQNALKETIFLPLLNSIDKESQNVIFRTEIFDVYYPQDFNQWNTGSKNILANSYNIIDIDLIEGFISDIHEDKAHFDCKIYIRDISITGSNLSVNDTLYKDFYLDTYYSYDDGIPEMGYGFKGYAIPGSGFATRFHNYSSSDTLQYIDLYLNPTVDSSNIKDHYVNLMVWRANGEGLLPGDSIGGRFELNLEEESSGFGYQRFFLDEPVIIEDDYFYIGWTQLSAKYINVGYDKSRNMSGKNYKFTSGKWTSSTATNVVMMRAGFGSDAITPVNELSADNFNITLYPNPADDYIRLDGIPEYSSDLSVNIFNLTGQIVKSMKVSENHINISDLKRGMYFLVGSSESWSFSQKFFKN